MLCLIFLLFLKTKVFTCYNLNAEECFLNRIYFEKFKDFPGGSDSKASVPTMREARVQSMGQEDPLEKETATPSSTLDWKIP